MQIDSTRGEVRTRWFSLRKLCLVALAGFLGSPLLLHGFNYWRHDLGALFGGTAQLRDHARELAGLARKFDQRSALAALGSNSRNGFFLRLDEHLDLGVAKAPSTDKPPPRKDTRLLAIEFEAAEPVTLASKPGQSQVADGVLRTKYAADDQLLSQGDFELDPGSVSEIAIRMKHSLGKNMSIGWNHDGELQNQLTISLLPVHGEFYEYRINASSLFLDTRWPFVSTEPKEGAASTGIKQIFLVPSDTPGDSVELDYVRFISKRSKYAKVAHGTTFETIANEMRSVIYVNSPLSLEFSVSLPAEKLWLETGLGVLENSDPVSFRIFAQQGETARELHSEVVGDNKTWRSVKLDLSSFGGQTVTLRLEATSKSGNVAFWSNPAIFGAPRERTNVVLLLEDALRADYLSCTGYSRNTTPAKDKLAEEGALFLNAFSQETKTRPSCPTLMTSLYPTATGVWTFDEVLHDNYVTLAEVMRSQGFETASFVQNPNAGPGAGLQQGFSYVFEKNRVGSRADELYRAAEAWIAEHRDRNLFVYLHVIDPHAPYDPPAPFDAWARELPAGGKPVPKGGNEYYDPSWVVTPTKEIRRANYAGEVAFNDACFGDFRAWLDAQKLSADMLMVQVADHGEFLGEHSLWDHKTPSFVPGIHVPLLMSFPGRLPAKQRIEAPVQLIDVMPSILELVGIDAGALLIEGRSLVPMTHAAEDPAWSQRVVVCDEVIDRVGKDDERSLASLFCGQLHLINSHSFSSHRRLPHQAYLRAFDRSENPSEDDYANSLYYDPILKYRVGSLVHDLQAANLDIWFGLTLGVRGTMDYDPETIARLRSLGYLGK